MPKETVNFMYCNDIVTRIGYRHNIDPLIREFEDMEVYVEDSTYLAVEDGYLISKKSGKTAIYLKHDGQYQKVNVTIYEEGHEAHLWNFEDIDTTKKSKIVSFGDSVTANATINADLTYVRNIANKYKMDFVNNYAIGGTTATYMYPGSNIYKEYAGNKDAIDGPRVVAKAIQNNELEGVEYAFIAFGHNDHYFQPPISVEGDDTYNIDNFDNAHSFKGSYRFMVNALRAACPGIKIILLGCTYSEYAKDGGAYGNNITYDEYRHAIEEVAMELECKFIDPWNYMKTLFDANTRKVNYKDVVHLTVKGHDRLATYLEKF